MEYPHFKVCVRCFTFNQSKYITDALNGFVMQQTDFPFVCCIVDDASTDGEQEAIKKYVEENFDLTEGSCHFERETDYAFITYAQHKTNKNCYFAVLYLKENHHSIKKLKMPYLAEWRDMCEYEAICEGDDYWICPNKIVDQVAFMDSHHTHSMVFGAVQQQVGDSIVNVVHRYQDNEEDCPIKDLFSVGGGYAKLNSMMYRINKYGKGYQQWTKHAAVGDLPIQLTLFVNGRIAYVDKIWSCYRCVSEGSWSRRMTRSLSMQYEWMRRTMQMWHYFNNYTNGKYATRVFLEYIKTIKYWIFLILCFTYNKLCRHE